MGQQVGQAAAQQEQSAEDDDVGVEHPLRVSLGEPQVALHLGQRHADDRRVPDRHELWGGERGVRHATPGVARLHNRALTG